MHAVLTSNPGREEMAAKHGTHEATAQLLAAYHRSKRSQAPLAVRDDVGLLAAQRVRLSQLTCDTCWTQFVATLLGLAAYITDHESELGLIWITAAIAYAAVIVYSVIVVVPFVNRLEAHAPDCTSSVSAAPLQRFSALHLWRTLFGTIGFALFVADAVIRR